MPAKLKLITAVMMIVNGSISSATELDVIAFSETKYTSNAKLSSFDAKEDVIERIGLNVLLKEARKRFDADAEFKIEQEFYLNNTFSDETNITTGIGIFNFDIIEDFLDWRTSFTRRQILTDASVADTPENRGERDILRTGPSINYRMNPSSRFLFGVNFIQVENSDEQSADTKRVEGSAGYVYQYNSLTSVSLNSTYDKIIESNYDDPSIIRNDDDIQNMGLNIGVNRAFTNGQFGLFFGQNRIESDGRDTTSGNFFSLYLQKQQFFWHELELNYSESLSDSSLGFDALQSINNVDVNQNFSERSSVLDIIKRKRFGASVAREVDLFRYEFFGRWIDKDYSLQPNDERSLFLGVNMSHNVSKALKLSLRYQNNREKFLERLAETTNLTSIYSLEGLYKFTKQVSFVGSLGYEKRKNNNNNFSEYERFTTAFTVNMTIF
jgi:predicted porin